MDNVEFNQEQILDFDNYFQHQEKNGMILRKSKLASTDARTEGNDIYHCKSPPHNKSIHEKILSLYTKSIAFAPMGSEELALGYSNRSALLMHLHKYSECMVDIDKALSLSVSEKIKEKLKARKAKSLKLMSEKDPEKLSTPLPKIITSATFPCAADCISLKYSKKYGRHMIATKDIKPGEIIVVEKGYTHANQKNIYLRCSYCMSFSWNGIPCDTCVFAIYCSDKCKDEAWKEFHDVECSILPYFHSKVFNHGDKIYSIILSVKILITLIKREGLQNILNEAKMIDNGKDMPIDGFLTDGIFDNKTFRSLYNLTKDVINVSKVKDNKSFEIMAVILLLKHSNILNGQNSDENDTLANTSMLIAVKNIIFAMKNILGINSFSFQTSICRCNIVETSCSENCASVVGGIIAPFCSLINHSCRPNVSRIFLPGGKLVLYTKCPIKKGEQLYETYGPTAINNKSSRIKYLKKFNFTCDCQACSQDWPTMLYSQCCERDVVRVYKLMLEYDCQNIIFLLDEKYFKNRAFMDFVDDEKLLKNSIKMCEIIHENFSNYEAFSYSLPFEDYICESIDLIYGEKCVIPDGC